MSDTATPDVLEAVVVPSSADITRVNPTIELGISLHDSAGSYPRRSKLRGPELRPGKFNEDAFFKIVEEINGCNIEVACVADGTGSTAIAGQVPTSRVEMAKLKEEISKALPTIFDNIKEGRLFSNAILRLSKCLEGKLEKIEQDLFLRAINGEKIQSFTIVISVIVEFRDEKKLLTIHAGDSRVSKISLDLDEKLDLQPVTLDHAGTYFESRELGKGFRDKIKQQIVEQVGVTRDYVMNQEFSSTPGSTYSDIDLILLDFQKEMSSAAAIGIFERDETAGYVYEKRHILSNGTVVNIKLAVDAYLENTHAIASSIGDTRYTKGLDKLPNPMDYHNLPLINVGVMDINEELVLTTSDGVTDFLSWQEILWLLEMEKLAGGSPEEIRNRFCHQLIILGGLRKDDDSTAVVTGGLDLIDKLQPRPEAALLVEFANYIGNKNGTLLIFSRLKSLEMYHGHSNKIGRAAVRDIVDLLQGWAIMGYEKVDLIYHLVRLAKAAHLKDEFVQRTIVKSIITADWNMETMDSEVIVSRMDRIRSEVVQRCDSIEELVQMIRVLGPIRKPGSGIYYDKEESIIKPILAYQDGDQEQQKFITKSLGIHDKVIELMKN